MIKALLYFGCIRESGHYLWINESMRIHNWATLRDVAKVTGVTQRFVDCIDGIYMPFDTRQGCYRLSHVPPFKIIGWHDYTIDKRPGSNSNLLAVGMDDVREIIDAALIKFPSVMKRQPCGLFPEELT